MGLGTPFSFPQTAEQGLGAGGGAEEAAGLWRPPPPQKKGGIGLRPPASPQGGPPWVVASGAEMQDPAPQATPVSTDLQREHPGAGARAPPERLTVLARAWGSGGSAALGALVGEAVSGARETGGSRLASWSLAWPEAGRVGGRPHLSPGWRTGGWFTSRGLALKGRVTAEKAALDSCWLGLSREGGRAPESGCVGRGQRAGAGTKAPNPPAQLAQCRTGQRCCGFWAEAGPGAGLGAVGRRPVAMNGHRARAAFFTCRELSLNLVIFVGNWSRTHFCVQESLAHPGAPTTRDSLHTPPAPWCFGVPPASWAM